VSGPLFLAFYAILALAANLLLRQYYRGRETRETVGHLEFAKDPYQIAILRNGAAAAVQTAVVSLLDRGLLEEQGGRVRLVDAKTLELALRPFEKRLLAACQQWSDPGTIEKCPDVQAACREYEAALAKKSLVADARVLASRWQPYVLVAGFTVGIAVARIAYALAQGRSNVIFLTGLALACWFALHRTFKRRLTGQGAAVLARLRVLFANLVRDAKRIAPGGQLQDLALATAVFGIAFLPGEAFPFLNRLYPKKGDSGGDSGDSSSSGGCGGGGCGGGGCGGCGG
jgi:uncharacterized protein (TIGR04222 family)